MLYLTLLVPFLALPALTLRDRVERWAAGDHPGAFRVARTAPTSDMTDIDTTDSDTTDIDTTDIDTTDIDTTDVVDRAAAPRWAPPPRRHHRPTHVNRLHADPGRDMSRSRVASGS